MGLSLRKYSIYTWFQTHPVMRYVLFGALLGGGVFLGVQMVKGRKKKTFWQRMQKNVQKTVSSIEMPTLKKERSLPQKVAHQATKQVANVSERLPFKRQTSWWEAIPLISMLPFLQRKSLFEKARDRLDQSVSYLSKSARQLGKTTGRIDKVSTRLNKNLNKLAKKQEKLIDKNLDKLAKT